MNGEIVIPEEQIEEFCRSHRIVRLSFFGSVLHDDFDQDSDLDVLVEFEKGHIPGLEFFSMEDELSRILKRKVDLNTPAFINKYFRAEVMAEAEVCYAAR